MTRDTPGTSAAKGPRTKRWIKIVLGLSLALNLLILGAIGGAVWRMGGPPDHRKGGPGGRADMGGFALIRALPAEDRRAMFRDLRAGPDRRRAEGRAQMQALVELLKTSPLDRAAFDALTSARQQDSLARQTQLAETWKARVLAMSDADRAAYAARLEEMLAKGPRNGKGGSNGGGKDGGRDRDHD